MADKQKRVSENIPGAYYVTKDCIACGLCTQEAEETFVMNDSGSYAYVKKQPESGAEIAAAEGARETCPADAIGNDGAD
jgi:ferredoxin